jgi:hypothetical protein
MIQAHSPVMNPDCQATWAWSASRDRGLLARDINILYGRDDRHRAESISEVLCQ